MLPSGESDASTIYTVNFKYYKNKGFRSKIVKVMVHFTYCRGKDKSPKNGGFVSEAEASDSIDNNVTGFLLPRQSLSFITIASDCLA